MHMGRVARGSGLAWVVEKVIGCGQHRLKFDSFTEFFVINISEKLNRKLRSQRPNFACKHKTQQLISGNLYCANPRLKTDKITYNKFLYLKVNEKIY